MPSLSSPAMVDALIIPRSATTRTRSIPNRSLNRSTTGMSALTSETLPGQSSQQIGLFTTTEMQISDSVRDGIRDYAIRGRQTVEDGSFR